VTDRSDRRRHTELVLRLAGEDQRLLDAIALRPHLLNSYPSIVTRLSRRSRKFRKKMAARERLATAGSAAPRLRLVAGGASG
jgi:hypothetical protein